MSAKKDKRAFTLYMLSLFRSQQAEKMDVVGIEFDRVKFDSPGACEQWIRSQVNTDVLQLLDRKTFRLKSNMGRFISDESRKVWCWYNFWDSKILKVERPNSNVVIIKKSGAAGSWELGDLPVALPSTQEKRQKLELARQRREFKRRETIEKLKLKRKKIQMEKPAQKFSRIPRKKKVDLGDLESLLDTPSVLKAISPASSSAGSSSSTRSSTSSHDELNSFDMDSSNHNLLLEDP